MLLTTNKGKSQNFFAWHTRPPSALPNSILGIDLDFNSCFSVPQPHQPLLLNYMQFLYMSYSFKVPSLCDVPYDSNALNIYLENIFLAFKAQLKSQLLCESSPERSQGEVDHFFFNYPLICFTTDTPLLQHLPHSTAVICILCLSPQLDRGSLGT